MKYGIIFKPTNEFVSFRDKDAKLILFADDKEQAKIALSDLLYADGGYDGPKSDLKIVSVDYPTNGSEFTGDRIDFYSVDKIGAKILPEESKSTKSLVFKFTDIDEDDEEAIAYKMRDVEDGLENHDIEVEDVGYIGDKKIKAYIITDKSIDEVRKIKDEIMKEIM